MNLLKLCIHGWRINILDSRIVNVLNGSCWLAGGAAKSIYNKDEIMDYDLFFKSEVEKGIVSRKLGSLGFRTVFECPTGELTSLKNGQVKVQLVTKRYYSNIDELLSTFDLTPSMFAYDGDYLYTYKDCIKDVKNRKLGLNVITYPVATVNRVSKYISKGYSYTEEFGVRLIESINTGVFDADHLSLYVD